MGSDRKTKEKNTKKRTSPSSSSSDSQDNGRRKKQRRGDEEESRSKKSDKKSHKHRSDKKKKSKDKHRTKHDKGDNRSKEFKELSEEDYFSKNNEFATWLKEEKNVFFSELSSESAREMFSDFMKAWNRQKLESRYYEGIVSGPRTAHKWKFKK
jgi:hypothetical protein